MYYISSSYTTVNGQRLRLKLLLNTGSSVSTILQPHAKYLGLTFLGRTPPANEQKNRDGTAFRMLDTVALFLLHRKSKWQQRIEFGVVPCQQYHYGRADDLSSFRGVEVLMPGHCLSLSPGCGDEHKDEPIMLGTDWLKENAANMYFSPLGMKLTIRHNFEDVEFPVWRYKEQVNWCFCEQPNDGHAMKKCSNRCCPIQWFHNTKCLGFRRISRYGYPSSRWYCGWCRKYIPLSEAALREERHAQQPTSLDIPG